MQNYRAVKEIFFKLNQKNFFAFFECPTPFVCFFNMSNFFGHNTSFNIVKSYECDTKIYKELLLCHFTQVMNRVISFCRLLLEGPTKIKLFYEFQHCFDTSSFYRFLIIFLTKSVYHGLDRVDFSSSRRNT